MFLPAFLNGRSWAARRCVQRAAHWRTLFPLLFLPGLLFADSNSADATPPGNGRFWGGFLLGLVLVVLVGVFARTRVKAAERESAKWKELADHREYERNVAQQEVV